MSLVAHSDGGDRFGWSDELSPLSAGLIRHDELVTATANMLAAMKDALEVRGARFASPRNSATIYGDYFPRWARNNGNRYDGPTSHAVFG